MSDVEDNTYDPFVIARDSDDDHDDVIDAGGTMISVTEARDRLRRQVANPDDPLVRRPPQGPHGPRPGPNYLGSPGRVAIVQGQVYIVAVILIAQLVLITIALFQLLSGKSQILWWITWASLAGFIIALVVYFWPRRRVLGR